MYVLDGYSVAIQEAGNMNRWTWTLLCSQTSANMTYFNHYEKSPNSALLGALIKWEQQKQTKDVHREQISVELGVDGEGNL